MKTIKTILAMSFLLFPGLVAADPFDRYVAEHRINVSNSGTIVNETHVSASSGGQTAAAGQIVDGDVSASAHVESVINAGNSGGTVEVHTETTRNGETESHDYSAGIAPGEPVQVHVEAHANDAGVKTEASMGGKAMPEEAGENKPETARSTERADAGEAQAEIAPSESGFLIVMQSIPSFFKKIFSFLSWW